MTTNYKINLINLMTEPQKMWAFLDKPDANITSEIFANSETYLTVPVYTGTQRNSFTIPLQYVVKVGATNRAVGLETLILSQDADNTDLLEQWMVKYFLEQGERQGPTLGKISQDPPPASGTVEVTTNNYVKANEPLYKWWGNMTWGVESQNGFLGVTWSPQPGKKYGIKPKVKFYIATGEFKSNVLADINVVSAKSAVITEASFDGNQECTVTMGKDGRWSVTPGGPDVVEAFIRGEMAMRATLTGQLIEAHSHLCSAHDRLIAMVMQTTGYTIIGSGGSPAAPQLGKGPEARESKGIKLKDTSASECDGDGDPMVLITGTITIATAIAAGFLYMWSAGIKLRVKYTSTDGLNVDFSYSGTESSQAVLDAFASGKEIVFANS